MKVIILRSVSGAGKSYVADAIDALNPNVVICCADDYFLRTGKYEFDASKLGAAHGWCLNKFKKAIQDGAQMIIVANTNTSEREMKPYIQHAEGLGIPVISLVVENRHGGNDVHGVPDAIKDKQEERLRNSLKLR